MTPSPTVSVAVEADIAGIIGVIRQGFQSHVLGLTPYGAHGIAQFVARQMSLPFNLRSRQFVVARASERVVGVLEFQARSDIMFINYVAVLPEYRGRGTGNLLLAGGLNLVAESTECVALDVFVENVIARGWYTRLGFEVESSSTWWDMPSQAGVAVGSIEGFPQAEVCHHTFGFSQFMVVTTAGSTSVGRLGPDWFRLVSPVPELLTDVGIILHSLDSSRRVCVISRGEVPPAGQGAATAMLTSLRLKLSFAALKRRLDSPEPPSPSSAPRI